MRISGVFVLLSCALIFSNCGGQSVGTVSNGTSTAVVAGLIGGASNDSIGTSPDYALRIEKPDWFTSMKRFLTFLPNAFAYTVTCTGGGTLNPTKYNGAGQYTWAPMTCNITFENGRSTATAWSGTYNYVYGANCTGTGFALSTQPAQCAVTRTTPTSGVARTITGFDGNGYVVKHDTNAPSGYSSSILTASTGNVTTCGTANCNTRVIAILGSHLTATATGSSAGGSSVFDQTVSMPPNSPLVINGTGSSKTVESGTLIIQDNLSKFYGTSQIVDPLTFTISNCCFPSNGTISTTFTGGPNDGKSELLRFANDCGEAVLTQPNGTTVGFTLQHCL